MKSTEAKQKQFLKIRDVQEAVAKKYATTLNELISSRRRQISRPRYMAMLLTRTITYRSLTEIGRMFEKERTVVMYGCNRAKEWLVTDTQFAQTYAELKAKLEEQNGKGG